MPRGCASRAAVSRSAFSHRRRRIIRRRCLPVPGYTHTPGHHCGSTALRNLLGFHGVEISEEMAFGLGAGACFYYVTLEDASPTRWFNGRTARLEENFDELTGAALELRTFEEGDGGAWEAARAEVDAGRPGPPAHRPLLPRPLRQLGPLPRPRRRPRRLRRGGRPCSPTPASRSCRRPGSRTSTGRATASHPAYPLAGHMFTASGERSPPERLREAIPAAIERAAKAMVEPEFREFSGLDAVAPPRRGGRRLARGRRGLAVVRALRLPGDRAARHRRRRLPADVLALPRGGGTPRGAAGRRGRGALDRARRRLPRRQRERRSRAAPLAGGRRRRPRRLRGRAAALDLARGEG